MLSTYSFLHLLLSRPYIAVGRVARGALLREVAFRLLLRNDHYFAQGCRAGVQAIDIHTRR